MRFTWTDEQQQLRETLREYLSERYSFEFRQRRIAAGSDCGAWSGLAELGVLGVGFEEIHGGSGGSALETLLIMEAFGGSLVVEPYVASVVLGGGLLREAGTHAQRTHLIPSLIAGETRFAFAFAEPQSRFNLAHVSTQARASSAGYVLSGRKIVVYGAPEAHQLFVSARTAGESMDRGGISLFLVPIDAAGVAMRRYTCIDGMTAAEITFDQVELGSERLVGGRDAALPVIERVVDQATVAVCAEAVGAMGALNERCRGYAKTREAFGAPIASFQVIGHRLVDMQVAYEQAAALTLKAAVRLAGGASNCARLVSACKVRVGREGLTIGKHAIHLHGAMGMTDELDVGHYFKRLISIATLFGDTDYHLRRYLALRESGEVSDGR